MYLTSFFQIYAVVTNVSELCNKYVSVQGEGEKEFEVQERGRYKKHISIVHGNCNTIKLKMLRASFILKMQIKLVHSVFTFFLLLTDDRFIFPMIERFNVQLFSPVTWEAIPNTK